MTPSRAGAPAFVDSKVGSPSWSLGILCGDRRAWRLRRSGNL